jgi:hypothetical protein
MQNGHSSSITYNTVQRNILLIAILIVRSPTPALLPQPPTSCLHLPRLQEGQNELLLLLIRRVGVCVPNLDKHVYCRVKVKVHSNWSSKSAVACTAVFACHSNYTKAFQLVSRSRSGAKGYSHGSPDLAYCAVTRDMGTFALTVEQQLTRNPPLHFANSLTPPTNMWTIKYEKRKRSLRACLLLWEKLWALDQSESSKMTCELWDFIVS